MLREEMLDLAAAGMVELIQTDAFRELIVYDMSISYDCADDWETKDALRKVVKYYTTQLEYDKFKKERGIE